MATEKDITGIIEHTVTTRPGVFLDVDSFIPSLINKLELTGGVVQYPYIDVIQHNDTNYVLGSLTLTRQRDFSLLTLTDETIEDANPSVGIKEALFTCIEIQHAKAIENSIVSGILADTNIGLIPTGTNWLGIRAAIADMGPGVFTIEGSIVVVMSQQNYLDLVSDSEYTKASKVLGSKLKVYVSEFIGNEDAIVYHEHGVAAGYDSKSELVNRELSLQQLEISSPYNYTTGWDYNYIRIAKSGQVDTDNFATFAVVQPNGTDAMSTFAVVQPNGTDAMSVFVVVRPSA